MSVEPSLAGGVCADCGTLITNAEVLAEVVVRVTAVTGSIQFHARCFKLS